MADSSVIITAGSGTNIDTRTETTNSQHRQVVVIGDPAINADVAAVASQDVASTDQTTPAVLVRVAGSATVVGLQGSTARPFIVNTDGALKIYDIVNGTVGVENLTRVRNVIDGTLSTVYRVANVIDGTLSTVYRVANVIDGTLSTVQRVQNLIDGTVSTVTRVDRVFNLIDGTISTVTGIDRIRNIVDGTISTIDTVTRVNRVFNLIDGTISTVSNITNTVKVGASDGTFAIYFSPSAPAVRDLSSTSVLPVTASSTSSAVSASGATVVSPIVGSVIKVFAFSLTTTAQVHLAARFTNGAGTSPTEFWRVALQAPSAGIAGANLAVSPPGYIWATAAGSTLSLVLDSASLVHYSVGYFRESA